ncbi:MAG: SRPBCC family protein [Acidimicrobiales bacterium]|jgi:hypothetical protein
MKVRSVSASRLIDAPAQAIFDLLADPRRHHELDGSTSVRAVRDAPARLSLGATFSMSMRIVLPYRVTNTVVVFDEPRAIAWQHWAQFIWRYDLAEEGGATRVTESFDYDRPWAWTIIALRWPQKNRAAMEETLATIERIVSPTRGPSSS